MINRERYFRENVEGFASLSGGGWKGRCPFHHSPGATKALVIKNDLDGTSRCAVQSCSWSAGGDLIAFEQKLKKIEDRDEALAGILAAQGVSSFDDPPIEAPFYDTYSPDLQGKLVETTAQVVARAEEPYRLPKKIIGSCDASFDKNLCPGCPMFRERRASIDVDSSSDMILRFIGKSDSRQRARFKEVVGTPEKCNRIVLEEEREFQNIYDVAFSSPTKVAIDEINEVETNRLAYVVDEDVKDNRLYKLTGRTWKNPDNQRIHSVWDKAEQIGDDLDSFLMNEQRFEALKVFQPADGERISHKLLDIYNDMDEHVHGVSGRVHVQIAVDLIFHSILSFDFRGSRIRKGWVEGLIIGDSGEAKTQLAENLMKHYGQGEKVVGDRTRATGLVGGIDRRNGGYRISWGAMPRNDRRILLIDEVSKLPPKELSKLSDVRSSGISRLDMIASGEAPSRCRLVMVTNPRVKDGTMSHIDMSSFAYPVEAIETIFRGKEDIRRLDFAIAVHSGEVAPEIINRERKIGQQGKYNESVCQDLVLWAWTRTPEQVEFTPEAETRVNSVAEWFSKNYKSGILLVSPASQRDKIARLAVALAARLFSTKDGEKLVVEEKHVIFVSNWLNRCYSLDGLGYQDYCKVYSEEHDITEEELKEITATIQQFSAWTGLVRRLGEAANTFRSVELSRQLDLKASETQLLWDYMLQQKLIDPTSTPRTYRKLPRLRKVIAALRNAVVEFINIDDEILMNEE